MEQLRFFIKTGSSITGPSSDDAVRDALASGAIDMNAELRLEGSDFWAPALAWATFSGARAVGATETPIPPEPVNGEPAREAEEVVRASSALFNLLRFVLLDSGRFYGPMPGRAVRQAYEEGRHRTALLCIVGFQGWTPIASYFEVSPTGGSIGGVALRRASDPQGERLESITGIAVPAQSVAEPHTLKCMVCLEQIPVCDVCPECGEPPMSIPLSSRGPSSLRQDQVGDSWLTMHWRPLITLGAVMALVCTGIMLRYLAPDRFHHERAESRPATVTPTCEPACWSGESCQMGTCIWNPPNNFSHVAAQAEPTVSGPFELPPDVSDVLPVDEDRFAIATIAGTQLRSTRTGEVLGTITEAPQTRSLIRVGDVIYAVGPEAIYVIDVATTRVQKVMNFGAIIGRVTVGASGRRALVSLPGVHAIAVISTDMHAEIDRIRFAGDTVDVVGTDDTGTRALTTTGRVPLAGLRGVQGGAVYAFDPSRLAGEQDRIRTSMRGNPVSVAITPDGNKGYVVLREKSEVVELAWQESGAVRQQNRIETCQQPEQIELVRRERRALVRCNQGSALEIFDMVEGGLIKHIPFGARASAMAISADGSQAIVTLPGAAHAASDNGRTGAVALVDLASYDLRLVPLAGPVSRVKLSTDGRMAVVLSDPTKTAWVIR